MKSALEAGAILALATTALAAPAAARATRAQIPSDEGIKDHIYEALVVDPRVDSTEVKVDVEDGYVTLSGGVRDLAGKDYAIRETEKIAGVKGVEDKLYVTAPWRPDEDIAQDVRHRIVNHSRIRSQGISVACHDGEVTLTGEVDAYVEERLAAELAGEVRGVRKVTNDLSVRYQSLRSDKEILDDVRSALQLDVYLAGLPISPGVQDGVVTLHGSVGSWYTRRRAENAVRWLPGVHEVENHLDVAWSENEGTRIAEPVETDEVLAGHVRAQLGRDTRIDSAQVAVAASSGGVTLSGSIPSLYQKGVALEDARDTVGVGWVSDHLTVGAVPRSDAAIRSDILWELDADYLLSGADLQVSVKDGIADLEGKLHTYYQRNHATDVAHRIRGVKAVVNDISVVGTDKSDAEIASSLESRLEWNWHTWWVHADIHVSVVEGTATLTGHVNTWAQRAAAGRIAFDTPGVWRVYNRLHVGDYPYAWDEWYEEPVSVWTHRSDSLD